MKITVRKNRDADPGDVENGFFVISNELIQALYRSNLSSDEKSIFLALILRTYGDVSDGNPKKFCRWSTRQAGEECNMSKSKAHRAWKSLREKNMILCEEESRPKNPGQFGPNRRIKTWLNSTQLGGRVENPTRPRIQGESEATLAPTGGANKCQIWGESGPDLGRVEESFPTPKPYSAPLIHNTVIHEESSSSKSGSCFQAEEEENFANFLNRKLKPRYLDLALKILLELDDTDPNPKTLSMLKAYLSKSPRDEIPPTEWALILGRCLRESASETARHMELKTAKIAHPQRFAIRNSSVVLARNLRGESENGT
jgi:hypothetical protein